MTGILGTARGPLRVNLLYYDEPLTSEGSKDRMAVLRGLGCRSPQLDEDLGAWTLDERRLRSSLQLAEVRNRSFHSDDRIHSGPTITVRNISRGLQSVGVDIAYNDPHLHHHDINFFVYLPAAQWQETWFRHLLFSPTPDADRWVFHTLVEVRPIYDQLLSAGTERDRERALVLAHQCRRALHIVETPKQYFRIKNNRRPLFERVALAPIGCDLGRLVPTQPYWERTSALLYIKDHNTYDIRERSQHLSDLLRFYEIPFRLFETFGTRSYVAADYLAALREARFMVAWSPEETHGQAMHEAKAMDVPIFTTTPNGMNYFSEACGMIAMENELHVSFEGFLDGISKRTFEPRRWLESEGLDLDTTSRNLLRVFKGEPSLFPPSLASRFLEKG